MTDTYTGPGEFLTITPKKDSAVVERHKERYRKAVRLSEVTGGHWLDCACGTGYGWPIIEEAKPRTYTGIDSNPIAIHYAKESFGWEAGWDPDSFIWLDIENADEWMIDVGPFHVILSLETLEHLTPDVQESWIRDAAGGLTDGGVFILACPIGNDGPSEYNRYHRHEPSVNGLDELLSRHFKSVEIETEAYVDTGDRDAIQAFAVCR